MTAPTTTTDFRREMSIVPSPLVGRESESRMLRKAIDDRRSLLVWGPAGVGKTALVLSVLEELPLAAGRSVIYLSGVGALRPLLRALLRRLYELEDPTLRRQLHSEGIRAGTFEAWLRSLGTSRLKGALYRSAENGQYWIFLDHMPPLTHAVAKVVKELVRMRDTPVYLLARGQGEAVVGHVADLYWSDPQRLRLGPLPEKAARELLECCIRRFGLGRFNLEGVREELLRLSGHVAGALVKMCALATERRYHYGTQIKTKLVHIDSLVSGYRPSDPLQTGESDACRRMKATTR
jgi:hypothetical protein